ncbi:FtsX-like permease family protein [Terrisporobacter glycolicus]|uniref:ABC3 transporter permease C-terminal domain-containing protein n=1 Tax=Terrisporobacter glycolicus ATCC 14880 = DSM 1288 TaxID=1121315 RepID=A0ABZ2ET97_9FIRM|nr:FtsX-like permease family protein [Terrisporobacter glycolicus]
MFFDLVKKNSKRNRKENGMFFVSLIVSIVAFYIILSLENQDVIIFLKEMESDAINRLLLLTPVLYAVSLFILFFLVYFAGKYQLERRSHELGMYLMLGMRRKKLFSMLLMEEIYNSILSLLIGIPIAIFISEMISMITARVVGIGIIGHKFSFSIEAVLWTVVGFFLIRLVALLILSGSIAKKDIDKLISKSQDKKHKVHNKLFTTIKLLLGIILLFIAYGLSINGYAWQSMKSMGITVVLGIGGTFLIFHGMVVLFEIILKNRKNKNGLEIFTFRQLQESVFYKSNSLAISSLLVLIALCCFGYGISVTFNSSSKNEHVLDYTFTGDEKEIKKELNKFEIKDYINEVFDVKVGDLYHEGNDPNDGVNFSAKGLVKAVKQGEDAINNLEYFDEPFLFSLSGYNNILKVAGKEPIKLKDNQAALFNGLEFSNANMVDSLNKALKKNVSVEIENKEFHLVDKLYQDNIVTDRSINIMYALIVPDKQFEILTRGDSTSYWNATLKEHVVKDKGLMQSIRHVNKLLDKTNLEYESYLQNMGRQLFYTVAASYTTIYLAVIFLIIANTVIGVQFLMQQQNTTRRYQTMLHIGCDYSQLRKSARKQIKWYFSLPILVAAIGSIFGIRGLFVGISTSAMKGNISELMIIAVPTVIILCVIEFSYMISVMKMSDKQIYELMDIKRDDN